MKQRDELEEKLKNLPRYQMDPERKRRNYYAIQSAGKGNKSKYFVYPLTLCTFFVMLFAGYVLFFDRNGSPSNTDQDEYTAVQMYFDGVEPIYSNSHIPDSIEFADNYHKGAAIGYLYHASIFYSYEGEKVNPLDMENRLDDYFDYTEEELDASATQTKVAGDAKPTWVYLNAANHYIDDEEISEKLSELSEMTSRISANKTFQQNYSIYEEVSREISKIVIEISEVTGDSNVYEGENEDWFVRLQLLGREDYLLYVESKDLVGEDHQVTGVSVSGPESDFSIDAEWNERVKYIYGDKLPEGIGKSIQINVDFEFNENEESLPLEKVEKVEKVNLNPK